MSSATPDLGGPVGCGVGGDRGSACRPPAAHDGRNVNEFEGFNKSENPKNPPHIAVSTTAGTGSETSWAYVITDTTTDPKNPHKYVAFDDASVTTLTIDDPVLHYSCPVDYTAQCGFDVLAHASEPYVSRIDFEPSLGNAPHAIKLTARSLREAVWNPQSYAGREGMMNAQYIAAQAFNSGGLGIIHSISHAVSAFYDTHHGLNNAVALPRVWAFNMPVHYRRFADIAGAMGVDTHGMTDVQAAEAALAASIRLLRDVGLIFGGDVLDVDANSDYGRAFGTFGEEYSSAINRRSTVIVLGDGRGNGNDPNIEAFAEITRRARETIWLTPEPRYSWGLGGCDLPEYAEYCSRVRVVRDLTGLETAAHEMAAELVGR